MNKLLLLILILVFLVSGTLGLCYTFSVGLAITILSIASLAIGLVLGVAHLMEYVW